MIALLVSVVLLHLDSDLRLVRIRKRKIYRQHFLLELSRNSNTPRLNKMKSAEIKMSLESYSDTVVASLNETGINRALAMGDFSIKQSSKVGVAQVVNRLTTAATLSHMRRINTPMFPVVPVFPVLPVAPVRDPVLSFPFLSDKR